MAEPRTDRQQPCPYCGDRGEHSPGCPETRIADLLSALATAQQERDEAAGRMTHYYNAWQQAKAALTQIKANRESRERGDECEWALCSRGHHQVGWPIAERDKPPVCEDCLIDAALLAGASSTTQEK